MRDHLIGFKTGVDFAKDRLSRNSEGLWRQRPWRVRKAVRESFRDARKEPIQGLGYIFKGSDSYSYFDGALNTSELAKDLAQNNSGDINLLDIGTGDGQLLSSIQKRIPNIRARGIGAHEFGGRTTISANHQVDFQIKNAETLLSYTEPNTYDVIVSRQTLHHLVDPLGTLAQMYEAVKPDGIILLDGFNVQGVPGGLPAVIEFLKQRGYTLMADYEYTLEENRLRATKVKSILIKKTSPHLHMPVTYDNLSEANQCIYKVNSPLSPHIIDLPEPLHNFYTSLTQLTSKSFADFFITNMVNFTPQTAIDITLRDWNLYVKSFQGMERTNQMLEQLKAQIPSVMNDWIRNMRDIEKMREEATQIIT